MITVYTDDGRDDYPSATMYESTGDGLTVLRENADGPFADVAFYPPGTYRKVTRDDEHDDTVLIVLESSADVEPSAHANMIGLTLRTVTRDVFDQWCADGHEPGALKRLPHAESATYAFAIDSVPKVIAALHAARAAAQIVTAFEKQVADTADVNDA